MFTKQKQLQLVALLLVVAFVLSACAGAGAPTTAPAVEMTQPVEAPAEQQSELNCPIVIAAAVHLTGGTAIYDTPPVEGARTAVKEINDAGGILGCQIQLLELDGKSDPAKAGDAAVVAVQQGAQILIAPCDFDFGSPVAKVAQENGLVGISECASSPRYNSKVLGDKQFTMSVWNNVMGAASAEHACMEMGWKRGVTVVDDAYDYGVSLKNFWTDAYNQFGCEIVLESGYQRGSLNFRSQAEEIVNLSPPPDVVMLAGDMPDAGVVVRELRSAGFNGAIVSGGALDTGEFYGAIGSDAGNIWITTYYFVDPSSGEKMKNFIDSFTGVNGRPPTIAYEVMGYDLIYILKQAIEKAGTVEGAALAKAMENTQFEVVGGTQSWSDAADGHEPAKDMVILEVKNGVSTFAGTVRPSYVPPVEE